MDFTHFTIKKGQPSEKLTFLLLFTYLINQHSSLHRNKSAVRQQRTAGSGSNEDPTTDPTGVYSIHPAELTDFSHVSTVIIVDLQPLSNSYKQENEVVLDLIIL